MREILTTMTTRGQVSVPAEVQRLLGLKPHDKVSFVVDDHEVRIRRTAFTLESAFQSVPALAQPLGDEEVSRIAKEDRVEEIARKLHQP